MAIFVGEFDQTIDTKHRLAIPSAFRDQLDPSEDGADFLVILGPDNYLWMYATKFYERLVAPLLNNPLPTRRNQRRDLMFALARVVKPDGQGRVVIPEKCLKRARIDKHMTLVGKGHHIELWPTAEWEKFVTESMPRYGEDLYEAGDQWQAAQADDN